MEVLDAINACEQYGYKKFINSDANIVFKSDNATCLANVLNNGSNKSDLYLSPTNFSITLIRSINSVAITCCNNTIDDFMSKVANPAVIIDGCNDINPVVSSINKNDSFVVIDDHNNIQIMKTNELSKFVPRGLNTDIVRGTLFKRNGKSTWNIKKMLDVELNGKHVDGAHVDLNYGSANFYVYGEQYKYEENSSVIKLEDLTPFVMNLNVVILALTKKSEVAIFYFKLIDVYNICRLLECLNIVDAIMLCHNSEIHIAWKYDNKEELNFDFIGDPHKNFTKSIIIN